MNTRKHVPARTAPPILVPPFIKESRGGQLSLKSLKKKDATLVVPEYGHEHGSSRFFYIADVSLRGWASDGAVYELFWRHEGTEPKVLKFDVPYVTLSRLVGGRIQVEYMIFGLIGVGGSYPLELEIVK